MMRNSVMSAAWSMLVRSIVLGAFVLWGAGCFMRAAFWQNVFVDVVRMHVMQMTFVKIIGVPVMRHCLVSAS